MNCSGLVVLVERGRAVDQRLDGRLIRNQFRVVLGNGDGKPPTRRRPVEERHFFGGDQASHRPLGIFAERLAEVRVPHFKTSQAVIARA